MLKGSRRVCYLGSIVARPKLKGIGGETLQRVTRAVNISCTKIWLYAGNSRLRLLVLVDKVKFVVSKNPKDRDNPHERLELERFKNIINNRKVMEKINVKPKLTDLIPFYGGIDYMSRTTYILDERPSIGQHLVRGVLTLAQIGYNAFVIADISNLLEGKPTLTQKILESFL